MSFQFELVDDGTPSIYETPTLFKKDSVGKVRTWRMQLDDTGRYRTLAGLLGGKQAESGWTTPVPASCETQKEQGEFEVRAQVKHQLDREYRLTEAELATVGSEFIQPMLAKSYSTWPGIGYAQPKLDGIRCIMTAAGMFSRQGQEITAVPHLHAQLGQLFIDNPDLVLDGELYSHDFREDFGAISSIVRKKNPTAADFERAEAVMQYHVYDIVSMDAAPYGDRYERLCELVGNLDCGWMQLVPARLCETQEEADTAYGEAVAAGYEGGMYRLDKPYEIGKRSKFLLKRKEFETAEFEVDRILPGNGNWAGAAKTFVLKNDPEYAAVKNSYGDGLFGAGVRGSYASLATMLQTYKRSDGPAGTVTLRFFGRSPDGVPRFPVVVDFQPNGRQD